MITALGNLFRGTLYQRVVHDYVRHYRFRLLGAAGCMIVMAAATAANANMMQPVLDDIFLHKDTALLVMLPLLLLVITFLSGLADYGQSYWLRYVGQRVVSDMQGDLFAHLLHADIAEHQQHSSGKLISRLTNDIMLMRNTVSTVLTGFVKESLSLIFLVGVMFYQGWEMAIGAFFVLLFAVLPVLKLGRRMRKVAGSTQSRLSEFTGQLDDILRGVRVVKAYVREEHEAQRVRDSINALFKLYAKAARIQIMSGPLLSMLSGFAIAGVIWYGGMQVVQGHTSPGAFFSFITAMLMAFRPVKVIAGLNTQMQEGMAAASRFYAVIDTKPQVHNREGAVPLTITRGDIALEHLSFTYPEADAGLFDVSLTIPAGKSLALVGASGGGKSTLMQLLLRFYDPQAGRITMDGHDIRNVTLASLRGNIALVSQEVMLFDDSVYANILYGRLDATREEVMDAATRAHAHEFIMELPDGYETQVGSQGLRLSGGQRQRISIARAILKNAPILLLDEATSALDSASERYVQHALESMMHTRTTLVIAHRLSTIRHADSIVVLGEGRIIEQGTHDQLLARGGAYSTLYQQQFATQEAA